VRDHIEAIYALILNIIMWVVEIFVVISQVDGSKAYTPAKKPKFFKNGPFRLKILVQL